VDVYADVNVDTPAGRVAVTADGRTVTVATDRYRTFRRIGAPFLAFDRPARRRTLTTVRDLLDATDTNLVFTVGSSEIGRIDRAQGSGLLSRVLGLPGVHVRLIPFVRALLNRS
jgi:hypothetical protein